VLLREERLRLLLAPAALFAGIAAGFLACCLAGFFASRKNLFQDFQRFHQLISPESLFYPTACQVRALSRERLEPGKVAVIVGGCSIPHGVGQRGARLWTRRLQELLGDDYCVLNLAMRGAYPTELGGAAAEMIARERDKVLFISCVTPVGPPPVGDGVFYRYFVWDAYSKGLLPGDPARDSWLRCLAAERRGDGTFAELRLGMRVDCLCYSRDLWTTLAYRHFATAWNFMVGRNFTRPRRKFSDPDPGPFVPFAARYNAAQQELRMREIRSWMDYGLAIDRAGVPGRTAVEAGIRTCFGDFYANRTLVLIPHHSPYYVSQLSPAEQSRYNDLFPAMVRTYEHMEIRALEIGRDYSLADYFDGVHIGETGGERMAEAVAPVVRDMARRLGYVP
jgi:hypothetical protein